MNHTNEYLELNWETDIKTAPPPLTTFTDSLSDLDDSQTSTRLSLTYMQFITQPFYNGELVQAEHTDQLVLSRKHGTPRSYRPYPYLWKYTVDAYINDYFNLVEILDRIQGNEKWYKFALPQSLYKKLENQLKERVSSRKNLNIREIKKHLIYIVEATGNNCKISKYGAGAYLNYVFKELLVRKDAKNIQLSLEYDGLKLCIDHKQAPELTTTQIERLIPSFTIVDYFMHEMLTGISLSIEITAILLELGEKLDKPQLWDEAFSIFCEDALPSIVQSKQVFARISVARLYFLQIFLDETIDMYRWKSTNNSKSLAARELKYRKALSHCNILNNDFGSLYCPDDQIQTSLNHIQDLLYEMQEPVNLFQIIDNPTRRLAIFCNPQHKHVSKFINELERLSSGSGMYELDNTDIAMFTKVHATVRKALNRDPS